ncbi:MAG: murein L,D-transpeptidase catalytic domain family protein [Bacteroidota bacterium]|nr:murein L,D-transpeptidase catalytic domain family protein [Bacteroidota bacterium]
MIGLSVNFVVSHDSPAGSTGSASAVVHSADFNGLCQGLFTILKSTTSKPDYEVFKKALTGFFVLKAERKIAKNILTIIDFSVSSRSERMWIIDINRMEVIHTSLVAHGHNSGEEYASRFSNSPSSQQSSLGFYITGNTYSGRHGFSLSLDGIEPGINDNARARAIVIHGADYVSRDFIAKYGRLGRSFGCPSIPVEDHEKIINMLSGRSCLYIYYPDDGYFISSQLFSEESAMKGLYLLVNKSTCLINFFPGFFASLNK